MLPPTAIPPPHHELIAVRAAMLFKGDNNREIGTLVAEWTDGLQQMQRLEGPGLGDRSRSKPWR